MLAAQHNSAVFVFARHLRFYGNAKFSSTQIFFSIIWELFLKHAKKIKKFF